MRSRRILRSVLPAVCALLLAVGAVGCAPQAGDLPPRLLTPTQGDKRLPQSDALLDRLVDPARPGCSAAVAVAVHGEVRWARAAGLADLATGEPLTTATRLNLASVSKQFTATAILILQREGLLTLGDPVGRNIDGLPAWGDAVTLNQLMHHTSHLREFWPDLEADGITFADPVSHDRIVQAIARQRTLEPGDGYLYTNSNYVLLAEVVHRVSGAPLPDFLAERIFDPLDLDLELSPNLEAPDVAPSYDDNDLLVRSGWAAYGASEVYSTPSELARWADQYRAGSIVGDDFAIDAVATGEGGRYGAGIRIEADGSLRHDGRLGGYISTFLVSADRETAIVVMCNGHLANRFGVADGLRSIWGIAASPGGAE